VESYAWVEPSGAIPTHTGIDLTTPVRPTAPGI
jgi:hypothetical protein